MVIPRNDFRRLVGDDVKQQFRPGSPLVPRNPMKKDVAEVLDNMDSTCFYRRCPEDFKKKFLQMLHSYQLKQETVISSRGYAISSIAITKLPRDLYTDVTK